MTTSALVRAKAYNLTTRLAVAVNWRIAAGALALFALFVALFAVVQFATPGIADNDGYYHMKLGLLMREQGLKPPFVWLPMSLLSREAFYDHHLLYHVYLALFAGDTPEALTFGAKIAAMIMPALAFTAVWWLLRGQRVRWASLWAVGLFAVSEAFLYRMSMPRAQSASLLILALGLHWMFQRRFTLLIPLGFVYVWAYNAFPLLIALAALYTTATFLTERRIEWQALVYPAIGIGLGLIVNPYFPQNVAFIVNHLAPKIGESETAVGNEWYPYQTWTLIENSGFSLAAFLLGTFAIGWRGKRIDRVQLTALLAAMAFGFLLFKSRRFVEYYPAFALIFAALNVAPLVEGWLADRVRWQRWLPVGMIVVLIVPLIITLGQARVAMGRSKPADLYAGASAWLKTNTSPGSLVFQTDWDDFTRLFFYNTSNLYTIGLDPTYMELYDADLYAEWVKITQGKVEQPSQAIRARFGGEYVMSDLDHTGFLNKAEDDPGLTEVYRDQYAVIFEVE
ncbi:MAG TPA: hypothetical protein VJG32_00965 [Anaerolineae bacterium]|nr:hypothetical protein [Anaerolineae bacterium]